MHICLFLDDNVNYTNIWDAQNFVIPETINDSMDRIVIPFYFMSLSFKYISYFIPLLLYLII